MRAFGGVSRRESTIDAQRLAHARDQPHVEARIVFAHRADSGQDARPRASSMRGRRRARRRR